MVEVTLRLNIWISSGVSKVSSPVWYFKNLRKEMREGTAWICIRPFFQQKNTIPEFFKTVWLANTFSNIKVCLDLEQDWVSLLKKGRVKASPARDDGTSWTDGLWYKRGGRGRCPPGLDTQGTSPTPLWDRVFISSNLSCLSCWPVGFCQQRWLGSSSDPRHSSPLTKEDSDQKHKCSTLQVLEKGSYDSKVLAMMQ